MQFLVEGKWHLPDVTNGGWERQWWKTRQLLHLMIPTKLTQYSCTTTPVVSFGKWRNYGIPIFTAQVHAIVIYIILIQNTIFNNALYNSNIKMYSVLCVV